MKKIYLLSLCLVTGLLSCQPVNSDEVPQGPPFDNTAYRPVYATPEELTRIETQPPRTLRKPGKIYVRDKYLFVNELGEGIHIINNSDPAKPEKIAFLSILASYDLAVKGNYLYADNGRDLVVFDISDPLSIKTLKRVEKAIPQYDFPPYQNVYFECVDTRKGTVVGWDKVSVTARPACFR